MKRKRSFGSQIGLIGQSVTSVISDILVDTPEVQRAKYPVIKEMRKREKKKRRRVT